MSDYIDRQQAIDAVVKEPYVADIDGAPTRVYRDVDVMWELYHLPSAQQWIPCSERLPEDDVEVMTTVEIISNGKRFVEQGSYFYHGWWCLVYDNLRLASNIRVIAWMPLPEPYKGGDAE